MARERRYERPVALGFIEVVPFGRSLSERPLLYHRALALINANRPRPVRYRENRYAVGNEKRHWMQKNQSFLSLGVLITVAEPGGRSQCQHRNTGTQERKRPTTVPASPQ